MSTRKGSVEKKGVEKEREREESSVVLVRDTIVWRAV
jgi:hypothetical protein